MQTMRNTLSLLVFTSAAFGQAAAVPAFEVASIKPSQGYRDARGRERENVTTSAGRLTMRNVTVSFCIKWAYGVLDNQVAGPAFLNSERYDIVSKATTPAGADEHMKLMLQALLAERFKLTFHRQSKIMSVYTLVVAKNGPRFTAGRAITAPPSTVEAPAHEAQFHKSEGEGKSNIQLGKESVMARWTTMAQFAELLAGPVQAPVLDMTGLEGRYDFLVDWRPYAGYDAPEGQRSDVVSMIIAGLQEQLGLKLESRKAPVDILVVDHIEKPSQN
jgi:uncharacterized protein (TIGR03435 family)